MSPSLFSSAEEQLFPPLRRERRWRLWCEGQMGEVSGEGDEEGTWQDVGSWRAGWTLYNLLAKAGGLLSAPSLHPCCSHSGDGALSPDSRQRLLSEGRRSTHSCGGQGPPVKEPERQQRRHEHVDRRDGWEHAGGGGWAAAARWSWRLRGLTPVFTSYTCAHCLSHSDLAAFWRPHFRYSPPGDSYFSGDRSEREGQWSTGCGWFTFAETTLVVPMVPLSEQKRQRKMTGSLLDLAETDALRFSTLRPEAWRCSEGGLWSEMPQWGQEFPMESELYRSEEAPRLIHPNTWNRKIKFFVSELYFSSRLWAQR